MHFYFVLSGNLMRYSKAKWGESKALRPWGKYGKR